MAGGNIRGFLEESPDRSIGRDGRSSRGSTPVRGNSSTTTSALNWAARFPTATIGWTATFPRTGYAPLLDLLCSGTYYPAAWRERGDSGRGTPQAHGPSLRAGETRRSSMGALLIQYQGNPEAFRRRSGPPSPRPRGDAVRSGATRELRRGSSSRSFRRSEGPTLSTGSWHRSARRDTKRTPFRARWRRGTKSRRRGPSSP